MPGNYRPIASLPYLSKIFERCMVNRLVSFFNNSFLFSKFQFGFLKRKSTSDALTELVESIYASLNERKYHISVLIDLTKAFDSVNHGILLSKMKMYGITGNSFNLFKSYLCDRKAFVKIGESCSSMKTGNIGVPQGSIIGPILFLIYINDLPNVSQLLQTVMFADDTTFSSSHHDHDTLIDRLNVELETISSWCASNRLTLNTKKTELLLFTKRPTAHSNRQVILGNETLSVKNSCTFLGTKLDVQLNFSHHIKYVTNKLSKSLGILFKIRNSLPMEARLNYYYAFIYPYLSYNVISWGGTNRSHLLPLIVLQKRIIRTICDCKRFDHTSPLFHRLHLLKFDDLFKYSVSIYMHGAMKDDYFSVSHHVNTRRRDLAVPTFHRLTVSQQALSYIGPTTWNQLPSFLRNINSLPTFKNSLKNYLIEQYIPNPN